MDMAAMEGNCLFRDLEKRIAKHGTGYLCGILVQDVPQSKGFAAGL
jgi:hypothetical protein